MNVVSIIPTAQTVDAAWARYQALAREVENNPKLSMDRNHSEAMIRAHRRFADLFNAMERAA